MMSNFCIDPTQDGDAMLGDWLQCYGYAIDREPRLLKGLIPRKEYRRCCKLWGRTGRYKTYTEYRKSRTIDMSRIRASNRDAIERAA